MNSNRFENNEDEDLMSGSSAGIKNGSISGSSMFTNNGKVNSSTGLNENQFISPEILGDPPFPTPSTGSESGTGLHEEVGNIAGTESGEEFVEATSEQLSSDFGGESAVSDFQGIEGFEAETASESSANLGDESLEEVGTVIEGIGESGTEEFGFLASLVPTLISSVGPSIAKAIAGKLKSKTRRRIKRLVSVRPSGSLRPIGKGFNRSSIISLIAKLLETAEAMPTNESDAVVDESLVEAAATVLEVVIGSDDRVHIKETTGVPWRRICALRIHFPNGRIYRGTGFFIGTRSIATAGHCVFLQSQGGWARKIEVIPGANGTTRPYGHVVSTSFRSVGGWVNSRRPESDYGCIVIPNGAFGGRNLGRFGFAAWDTSNLVARPAILAGYPGDKPFAEMWGMARRVKTITAEQLIYDIDTVGGQSGAPVYIKRNNQRYVVGIHNYGASSGNSATRITQSVYKRLLGWSQI